MPEELPHHDFEDRLAHAEHLAEFLAIRLGHGLDLTLGLRATGERRDAADGEAQAREDLGRRLRDVLLAHIDHGQHGTRGEESVQCPQFGTHREIRVFVDALAVFEELQATLERIKLLAWHAGPAPLAVGLVAFEPRLDQHLVGQDHFGEQRVEVRARIVRSPPRRRHARRAGRRPSA